MLHLSHCPTKPNFGLQNEPKLRYIAPSFIVACAVTPFVFAQTFTSGCFERDSTGALQLPSVLSRVLADPSSSAAARAWGGGLSYLRSLLLEGEVVPGAAVTDYCE
jgi:hypothetical protein